MELFKKEKLKKNLKKVLLIGGAIVATGALIYLRLDNENEDSDEEVYIEPEKPEKNEILPKDFSLSRDFEEGFGDFMMYNGKEAGYTYLWSDASSKEELKERFSELVDEFDEKVIDITTK